MTSFANSLFNNTEIRSILFWILSIAVVILFLKYVPKLLLHILIEIYFFISNLLFFITAILKTIFLKNIKNSEEERRLLTLREIKLISKDIALSGKMKDGIINVSKQSSYTGWRGHSHMVWGTDAAYDSYCIKKINNKIYQTNIHGFITKNYPDT